MISKKAQENLVTVDDLQLAKGRIKAMLYNEKVDDIKPNAGILLAWLEGRPPLFASELRLRNYYLGQNVTYTLDRLEEGGYIQRKKDTIDKRRTVIHLTKQGEHVALLVQKTLEIK